MDILADVATYIERHALIPPGARVVVGVSGGADSLALADVLQRLAYPLHIAHLHHGLRGAEADADAEFVAEWAAQHGWPCTVAHADVGALARDEKLTLEEAARHARYAFLARVAAAAGADFIAVGHNADDQTETVLMHLLRGAGLAGLRGMLPATPLRSYRHLQLDPALLARLTVVRPLLTLPRVAIEAYCAAQSLAPRRDSTNSDVTFFRNRLRHEVLPYLRQLNPRIDLRLQNLAQVVQGDYALLEEFVAVAWDELLVEAHPDALTFNLSGWRRQSLSVQRALIRHAICQLHGKVQDVDFVHVDNAAHIAQNGITGDVAVLPGNLRLTLGYTTLTLSAQGVLHLPPERPWLFAGACLPLLVPGRVVLPDGWSVQTQVLRQWEMSVIAANRDPFCAWIDGAFQNARLFLRTRRLGDHLRLPGLGGARTRLSDLLINLKFPQAWRDHVPLLEADGRLLWVVGLRLCEPALIHAQTQHVIHICFNAP